MRNERAFSTIKGVEITRFGPGESAHESSFKPGDFILTHSNSFFGGLIRFGQRLRFRGKERPFAWWNHAAMIVSQDGELIEALDAGVRHTRLSKYKKTEYHLVHLLPKLTFDGDRDEIVNFARWSLNEPYGWATIISISISLITGCKFNFGFDGQTICSGLVARALERSKIIFDRTPDHITPADLAKYFDIRPGPQISPRDIGKLPPREKFWP